MCLTMDYLKFLDYAHEVIQITEDLFNGWNCRLEVSSVVRIARTKITPLNSINSRQSTVDRTGKRSRDRRRRE